MTSPEKAAEIVNLLFTRPDAADLFCKLIYGTSLQTGYNLTCHQRLKARAKANGVTIMAQRQIDKALNKKGPIPNE